MAFQRLPACMRILPDYRVSEATRNLRSGVYFSLVLTITFPESDSNGNS